MGFSGFNGNPVGNGLITIPKMGKQWKRTSFDHHRSNKNERKGNRAPSKNDLKSEKKWWKSRNIPKSSSWSTQLVPVFMDFHGKNIDPSAMPLPWASRTHGNGWPSSAQGTCGVLDVAATANYQSLAWKKGTCYSRKLLFPTSLQLKGARLPQENWCCLRLTIIIRLELFTYTSMYRLPVFYFISYGARINQ